MTKNNKPEEITPPLTLEEALQQLSESQGVVILLEKDKKDLTDALAIADQKLVASEEKYQALVAEKDTLETINMDLQGSIEKLSEELDGKKETGNLPGTAKQAILSTPSDTFEIDGTRYKFICPVFTFKGQRLVAADLINNTDALMTLVTAGVGFIQKVK
ncbi:MAG: hypothetical protein ACTHMV_13575 [Chitinophagaceae bacterium]